MRYILTYTLEFCNFTLEAQRSLREYFGPFSRHYDKVQYSIDFFSETFLQVKTLRPFEAHKSVDQSQKWVAKLQSSL